MLVYLDCPLLPRCSVIVESRQGLFDVPCLFEELLPVILREKSAFAEAIIHSWVKSQVLVEKAVTAAEPAASEGLPIQSITLMHSFCSFALYMKTDLARSLLVTWNDTHTSQVELQVGLVSKPRVREGAPLFFSKASETLHHVCVITIFPGTDIQ